ncbi:MAG: TlyA family RNA methyltransferase [Candidatus Bipolaricaulota bacterium]
MADKERLDVLIAKRGYCSSREKAKRQIMAGNVYVGGRLYDKPGKRVQPDAKIIIKDDSPRYVSRGGEKLEKALDEFEIDLSGKKAVDIGSSTGGFTDCLLQKGAGEVWAVDVGKGQLDWKLRNDSRVNVLEETNARYLDPERIGEEVDLVTIDVSFISLELILPSARPLLGEGGKVISLVKPQFEAGPELVERGGVVRDPDVHVDVIQAVSESAEEVGLLPTGLTFSPIRGKNSKNIEYPLLLSLQGNRLGRAGIVDLVRSAHDCFEN